MYWGAHKLHERFLRLKYYSPIVTHGKIFGLILLPLTRAHFYHVKSDPIFDKGGKAR